MEKALKATVIVDITSRFNSERLWLWRETAQANVNADLIKFQFLKAHKTDDFLCVVFFFTPKSWGLFSNNVKAFVVNTQNGF